MGLTGLASLNGQCRQATLTYQVMFVQAVPPSKCVGLLSQITQKSAYIRLNVSAFYVSSSWNGICQVAELICE
jgi:hypothetical protein